MVSDSRHGCKNATQENTKYIRRNNVNSAKCIRIAIAFNTKPINILVKGEVPMHQRCKSITIAHRLL